MESVVGWHQMVIGFPKLTHMFQVFSAFSTNAQQHRRETYGIDWLSWRKDWKTLDTLITNMGSSSFHRPGSLVILDKVTLATTHHRPLETHYDSIVVEPQLYLITKVPATYPVNQCWAGITNPPGFQADSPSENQSGIREAQTWYP
jgi:hypothetical protein